MNTTSAKAVTRFVSQATERKYQDSEAGTVCSAVEDALAATKGLDEQALLAVLGKVGSLRDDVRNQTIVLVLIDRYWRSSRPSNIISRLHAAACGHPFEVVLYRKSAVVADFGGSPPIAAADVPGAFGELELVVERLAPTLMGSAREVRAMFLAHLFSSIIRIHPFEDGNGRAARFTVQYCLRVWNLPWMPLPKFRNDRTWADAMVASVNGDIEPLVEQFRQRLNGVFT